VVGGTVSEGGIGFACATCEQHLLTHVSPKRFDEAFTKLVLEKTGQSIVILCVDCNTYNKLHEYQPGQDHLE
jgi:hypothetical protein